MPRVQRSKLANPPAPTAQTKRPKSLFNNGEKRLTGRETDSLRSTRERSADRCKSAYTQPIGTGRAIKDKVLSGTATAAVGDAKIDRFRVGRRSTGLSGKAVENIIAAAVFTLEKHRPLNRHTTIHFEVADIDQPIRAIGRYLKLAGDWLRTQGETFAYIWVRESGEKKGEHVHILMHVPTRLAKQFALRERGWRKRMGASRRRGAFHSTPVGQTYRHGEIGIQFGKTYSEALSGIVGYLVKGAEPRVADALALGRVAPGGELWGKRTGMSENIGRAARARTI